MMYERFLRLRALAAPIGPSRRPPSRAAIGLAAITLAAAGVLTGTALGGAQRRPGSSPDRYAKVRAATIAAHLRQVRDDYVLLAGDSHIEQWHQATLCGLPVVNAGVGGATAEAYGEVIRTLAVARPPRAVLLTIGTNNGHASTAGEGSVEAFEAAAGRLLGRLAALSPRMVVTAVPPVDPERATGFSPALLQRFSDVLRAQCERRPACAFVDPFSTGGPVRFTDGVHLVDYAARYAPAGDRLCASLSQPQTDLR